MTEFSGSDIPITIDAEDKLGRDERSGSSANHTLRNQNKRSHGGPRVYKLLPPKVSNEI